MPCSPRTPVPRELHSTPEMQEASTALSQVLSQTDRRTRPTINEGAQEGHACALWASPPGVESQKGVGRALRARASAGSSPKEAWT